MNLKLNPKQFLAVYNSLNRESAHDILNNEIHEVLQLMEEKILSTFERLEEETNSNKFSKWFEAEQEKITSLEAELNDIKSGESLKNVKPPVDKTGFDKWVESQNLVEETNRVKDLLLQGGKTRKSAPNSSKPNKGRPKKSK